MLFRSVMAIGKGKKPENLEHDISDYLSDESDFYGKFNFTSPFHKSKADFSQVTRLPNKISRTKPIPSVQKSGGRTKNHLSQRLLIPTSRPPQHAHPQHCTILMKAGFAVDNSVRAWRNFWNVYLRQLHK